MDKVLLINCPQFLTKKRLPFGFSMEPLHLLYLCKVIKNVADPVILDYTVRKYNKMELIDILNRLKPKIIAFTFTAASYLSFNKILKDITPVKKKNRIVTIAGGVQAFSMPEYIFRNNPDLDYIAYGEGEIPFKEFVDTVGNKSINIKNIFYRNADGLYEGDESLLIDIDQLGWPDRSLISQGMYRDYKTLRKLGMILSTRGCPYKCSFCYYSKKKYRRIRYRSVEGLIEEILEAKKIFDIHQFYFLDDFFTFNIERVKSFCDNILKNNIKISWSCQGRADHGSFEMFKLMYDSGCTEIGMGIENIVDDNLNYIGKKTDKDKMIKTINEVKKAGLNIRGNFIIGFPSDSHETIITNIEFAASLKLQRTAFFMLTPYPHSKIWDEAVNHNIINPNHIDWSKFNQLTPFFINQVSSSDLIRYCNWGNQHTSNNIKQKIYHFFVTDDKKKYVKDYLSYYHHMLANKIYRT